MKKILSTVLAFIILLSTTFEVFAGKSNDEYCYKTACLVTKASIDYLSEIYINKYPNLGIGYLYGSDSDKAVIKTMTEKIIAGSKTNREKINSIVNWVKKNIDYKSMHENAPQYPIDVFYYRKGNCVGISQLIRHMARTLNIPAVVCDGTRGDMKTVCKLENREANHEWIMIYCDNKWLLFDPLFDVFGVSDIEYISSWYFFDLIEGISPYYDGIQYKYVNGGDSVFYKDGRFIHYKNGVPASKYYGNAAQGGTSVNGCISYFTLNRYFDNDGIQDGFEYLDNPERINQMLNDECYSNGWVSYGNNLYYAKENGIVRANQIFERNGKLCFAAFDGSMLEIKGNTDKLETTEGYITIHKNIDNIRLIPVWAENEKKIGRVLEWENYSEDIIKVDSKGNITPTGEGLATLLVKSKEPEDTETHFLASFVQVYVTKKGYRQYSYKDTYCSHSFTTTTIKKATTANNGSLIKKCTKCGKQTTEKISLIKSITLSTKKCIYDGKEIKPTVTVKDSNGMTIASSNYTVSYSNNTNAGTGKVTITFKGNYSGTKTVNFTITPKQVTGLKASTIKTDSIKLTWSKTAGAKYYKVEQSTDGKKWKTLTTTDKTSYTVKKLKAGTKYQFRVTALDSTKKISGKASSVLKTGTLTSAPTVTLKSSKSKTAVASWKKVTGASKYIVYKSTDGKKWTKVTTTTKLTYTLTKLTGGKKIYVKVTAVNAYSKESADSKVVSATVKK